MSPTDMDLRQRDTLAVWHPATHFADLDVLPPLPIARARGAWLHPVDGPPILDAISSWWTCVHGHGHPAIAAAIAKQAAELDHVMFAGFTHAPAVDLAEQLLRIAPGDMGRVFFTDCGSAAIEAALKLSFQAHQQSQAPRRQKFAALDRGYHGETLGALAACGSATWRGPYSDLLFDVTFLPTPQQRAHRHADLSAADLGADSPEADAAVAALRANADELAALVIEPIVQCAGKMSMPGVGYYRRICETARELGIHIIADEIAVAFGRTGKMFAGDWAGLEPDLICVSKGLSGGVLPLAAVLVRRGFEDAFRGDPSRSFPHSHTFTANPITCAAANASLRLFAEEQTLVRVAGATEALAEAADRVAGAAPVVRWRQAGTIVAFELDIAGIPAHWRDRPALHVRRRAIECGVLLRPLHDTLYWMPPLSADDALVEALAARTLEVLCEQ